MPSTRAVHCRGLFLNLDHGAPHVVAAFGADGVRGHGLAALRAVGKLLGRFVIVGPAAAGFLIRLSSLRDCHVKFLRRTTCRYRAL